MNIQEKDLLETNYRGPNDYQFTYETKFSYTMEGMDEWLNNRKVNFQIVGYAVESNGGEGGLWVTIKY